MSTIRRARIVICCLAAGCAAGGRAPTPALDAAAARYVELAAAVERRDAGVAQAIAAVRSQLRHAEERDGRRAFLLAQTAALERRARFLDGERTTVRDEARALGLDLPRYDTARAADLRNQLRTLLPGGGSIAERLTAHRLANALPRSRLDAAATRMVGECRARAPVPAGLRDGGVELRYVIERPWPAFTSYRGDGASTVEIRRDASWLEDDLFAVLCHETYSGHHLQNLVWDDLRRARRWPEFGVVPVLTPIAVMAERLAVAATAITVPPASRAPISRLLGELAPFALATAVAAVDGELGQAAAIARLRDDLLMPDPDGFLAFVREHRSMAVAYVAPLPDVRDRASFLSLLRSPERLVARAVQ